MTGTGRTGPACSGVSAVCGSQKLGTLPDGTTPPSKNSRAINTQPNPREEAVLLRVGTRTTRAPRRKSRSSEGGLRSAVTSRTMMHLVLLLWHGAESCLAGCTSLNSHHGPGRRQCYLRLSNEARGRSAGILPTVARVVGRSQGPARMWAANAAVLRDLRGQRSDDLTSRISPD